MKMNRFLAPVLGLALMGGSAVAIAQQYGQGYPPPPPQQWGQRGWDAPPGELREFQHQGYLDGLQGAERDYQNHRIWNVNNRDEFRHPHVPGNVRGDYRDGFKKGYLAAEAHYQGVR